MRLRGSFCAGLVAQGVAGCGSIFPASGGAEGDTHFVMPAIDRTWKQIWDEDLAPYRALHASMPMIMTNHAAFPETKGGMAPASASRFWITKVLRRQIGYKGHHSLRRSGDGRDSEVSSR